MIIYEKGILKNFDVDIKVYLVDARCNSLETLENDFPGVFFEYRKYCNKKSRHPKLFGTNFYMYEDLSEVCLMIAKDYYTENPDCFINYDYFNKCVQNIYKECMTNNKESIAIKDYKDGIIDGMLKSYFKNSGVICRVVDEKER